MEGYDYGARYYLPQMGTWMSADSEASSSSSPGFHGGTSKARRSRLRVWMMIGLSMRTAWRARRPSDGVGEVSVHVEQGHGCAASRF